MYFMNFLYVLELICISWNKNVFSEIICILGLTVVQVAGKDPRDDLPFWGA